MGGVWRAGCRHKGAGRRGRLGEVKAEWDGVERCLGREPLGVPHVSSHVVHDRSAAINLISLARVSSCLLGSCV